MIIDIHNHPDWYGYDLQRFLENMEKYNIDRTWLLSWESPASEYNPSYRSKIPDPDKANGPISFERCLSYVQRAPEKFVLGYAPDPRLTDAIDKLDHAIQLYGVKIYGELKLRMMYDNPDALRMYRFCGRKGLPVLVHIDYEFATGYQYPRPNWWYGGGIDAFERAIKACPETIFIGHAPGFWAHISDDGQFDQTAYPKGKVVKPGKVSEMLDLYPNLHCDISAGSGCNALKRDPEFAKDFLIQYQDRIMYGRDYFDNVHQEFLATLDLPLDVLDKIYYKNALQLIP